MDKQMMMAWLKDQVKKQELTTTKMQQKRLGIDPQYAQKKPNTKKPENPQKKKTESPLPQTDTFGPRVGSINEQLSAEEEKYAKEHKSMLTSMIKQYGKEKGTSVFYGKVRKAVKELKEGAATLGTKLAIDFAKQGLAKHGASKAATDLIAGKMVELAAEKPGTVGKIVAVPRTVRSGQTPQMKADMILPTPQIADYEEITPEARERLRRLGY